MNFREASKIEPGYHVNLKGYTGKRFEVTRRTFRYSITHPNRIVFSVRNVDDPADVLFDVLHTDIK